MDEPRDEPETETVATEAPKPKPAPKPKAAVPGASAAEIEARHKRLQERPMTVRRTRKEPPPKPLYKRIEWPAFVLIYLILVGIVMNFIWICRGAIALVNWLLP